MVETLRANIQENGMQQGDLRKFLSNTKDVVNELQDDHATYKTLTDELHDDHATIKTLTDELHDDHAPIHNYVDFLGEPDGVIGGDFTISAGAAVTLTGAGHVRWRIGGETYYGPLDTTITLDDSGDIATTKWGAWRILIDRAGTVTTQDTGAQMAWANEQDALLNLSAVAQTANTATIGYFTINSDGGFNIGTDNVNGETAANLYIVRQPLTQASGLTAALGSTVVADTGAATWSVGTVDVKRNGLRLTQIGAITNQAMDDADIISTTKAGGWLLVVDLAGTGVYALAADGNAGAASTMAYASTTAVDTALDTLTDQLPEVFVPIGKIVVDNQTGGNFTAGTTNWDATSVTTTVTNATLGTWDRTSKTGFDSHKINPPAVTAALSASKVATLTASKVATLTNSTDLTLNAG